jgi:hypothetical protein
MDTKTLKIVHPTEAQLRAEPDRYVEISEDEVNAVKAMNKSQRLDWLNRKQRRASAAKRRKSQ